MGLKTSLSQSKNLRRRKSGTRNKSVELSLLPVISKRRTKRPMPSRQVTQLRRTERLTLQVMSLHHFLELDQLPLSTPHGVRLELLKRSLPKTLLLSLKHQLKSKETQKNDN